MTYSITAFQLTHLLQQVYDKLEQTKGLLATGGTTTTIVDSAISSDVEDDAYNGWTAFITTDAGGAGAAPEGEYRTVTDYVQSTTTLTVGTAFSVSPAAGDFVTIARGSLFPLNDVIRLCNNALRQMGKVPNIDTSLTTGGSQTEYNIPASVQWDEIVMVERQTLTGDSDNNLYVEIGKGDWRVIPPTSAGGTATLVLPQYASGYNIRITSMGLHAKLTAYDSTISKAIPETLAIAACALACARWKRNAVEDNLMSRLETDFELARIRNPMKRFVRSVRGMPQWDNERRYQGDQSIYDRGY